MTAIRRQQGKKKKSKKEQTNSSDKLRSGKEQHSNSTRWCKQSNIRILVSVRSPGSNPQLRQSISELATTIVSNLASRVCCIAGAFFPLQCTVAPSPPKPWPHRSQPDKSYQRKPRYAPCLVPPGPWSLGLLADCPVLVA